MRHDITHPVANDRDFKVWNAFEVNAWPTLVLIDPEGNFVGHTSGEGQYDILDRAITRVIKAFLSIHQSTH